MRKKVYLNVADSYFPPPLRHVLAHLFSISALKKYFVKN